ncbi:hypothetical protein X975_02133, partial [Stegodyphus mimosarum]
MPKKVKKKKICDVYALALKLCKYQRQFQRLRPCNFDLFDPSHSKTPVSFNNDVLWAEVESNQTKSIFVELSKSHWISLTYFH